MITGDNKDTASAIARDIGMLDRNSSDRVFDAAEFFSLESNRQRDILDSGNLVFSRTKPTQKQTIVEILQSNGEIVAMTGDGVNDSPALKRASIGIAMGSGTDVAKETADMVLLDDSFSSIVQAVAEGRSIYTNMKAFVNFLLSCNLGEVFAVVLASLLGLPSMLTATQLLWVNLVTDGLPAVALGFNPPDRGLMDKPPRSSDEEFIDNVVLLRYVISGAYIGLSTAGTFIFYFVSKGLSIHQLLNWSSCVEQVYDPMCSDIFSQSTLKTAQTLALTTLVCTELLKALCSVSTVSLFKFSPFENPYLIASVVGSMVIHVLLVYSDSVGLSILGESLGLVPITMNDWFIILGFSLPILLIEEIIKVVIKR
jgi:magnesium-transporting ATPase (P-type)